MKVTKDGPLFFEKPGWKQRYCPYAKTPCLKEGCIAFQFEQPTTVGGGAWYGDQPKPMNITCKALGVIFEIWDAEYVQENMAEIYEGMVDENGDGETEA